DRLADADRPVGQLEVGRAPVRLRIDGDGLDPQLLARADDPERNLTAVGDQDSLKHRRYPGGDSGLPGGLRVIPRSSEVGTDLVGWSRVFEAHRSSVVGLEDSAPPYT